MVDKPISRSAELSRRALLQNLAYATGGAAVFAASASSNRASAAPAKVAQKAVGYQDTPKGAQRCDNCTQFEAPTSCKVVEGSVAAAGWCKIYVKKPA